MSMKKNIARRVFGIAMLAAGVFLFTGCPRDIGLGSAVDTAKPVISITSPEADSVINGSFTITGSVTDDLAVKSVTVTFTSTSEPSLLPKTYPATVNAATNTWSLTVDSTDAVAGLIDSNYEIVATALDTTNKTSTAARSYQLDNTAPTVLITSPSLYGTASNRTQFCGQIEIKGEAYDATKIQKVEVYLCDAQGTVVAGPVTADGTNTWSAMFAPDDLTALQNIQGTPTYYFYAVATDESGNRNSTFYHKADIYSLPNSTNPFPSMNDIGHLDQGTTSSASCHLDRNDLLSIRIETGATGITAAVAAAAGTAHPENPDYPDFTYQTSADASVIWTNLNGTDPINVGSGIFATIQPPTDNSAILVDSIVLQIKEANGTVLCEQGAVCKKVGESVNITIPTPEYKATEESASVALVEGSYVVQLSCETNSLTTSGTHTTIVNSQTFEVQSLTDAPKVTENGSNATYAQRIVTGDFTELSGTFLNSGDNPISTITDSVFKIVCKSSTGEDTWYIDPYGGTGTKQIIYNEDGQGTWKTKQGVLPDADDTYTFTITGKVGSAPTTITRVIVRDTTAPVITLVSPADQSTLAGNKLAFQGTAMDAVSGVTTSIWCIDVASAPTPTVTSATFANASNPQALPTPADPAGPENCAKPVKSTWYKFISPTSFNKTYADLSDLTTYPEGSYKIFVAAMDEAGHISDVEAHEFVLDGANPEIRVLSMDASGNTKNAGFTLGGTAWDTNGLDSISISDGTRTWSSTGTTPAVTLVKKTADPGTTESDWNWHIDYVVGSENASSANYISDGTKTFTITVKDISGKIVSDTRTVTVDTVNPVISAATVQNELVKLDETVYDRLTVTATDGGTGLAGVYYQVLASNSAVPAFTDAAESAWTSLALGAAGWTGNADFSTDDNKTEGKHYIYVAAKDNAGNRFVRSTPVPVTVDKQKPVITVTGAADAGASNVTLTVRVTDTNPSDPVIKVLNPAGTELSASSANLTVTAGTSTTDYKEWSVVVPFSSASYSDDGVYSIVVNETDTRTRAATQVTHGIRKDKTAPEVNSIDSPEAGMTGTNALYGTSYLFRGTAKDKADGSVSSGLAKIFYVFTRSATPPAITEYTEKEQSDGTWTITKSFNEGDAPTAGTDNLYEGKWYLYVLAEDKAGNRTSSPCVREFDIDMSAPVLTVTAPADITQTKFTRDDTLVITGTATDTNGVGSLKMQLGNADAVSVTVNAGGAWTYSFNKAEVTNDELLSAKFVLTDVAGKTTDKTVPFFFDTEAPSVTISLPGENETTPNNTYTLTGTAADTGSGIDASTASYVIKKGTDEIASGALTITGASWKAENVSLGSAEGELTLTVTIKDKLGWSTSVPRTFYYDLSNPELKELSVTANGLTTTQNFKLAGTAWDTNELASITVSDGTTTWTSTGNSAPVTLTPKTSDPGDAATNWNWHIDFGVDGSTSGIHVDEGTKTFTITAKDVAGKTASTTRTVTVDTIAPAISAATVENTLVKLDESVYDKLTVTASDGGTGLAGVYYQVLASNSAVPDFEDATESAWTSLALGAAGWTGNADFSTDANKTEGKHYIYVAAKDNAGNRFVRTTPITVTVDKQKPVITVTGATDTGASATTLTIAVNDTNPDASKLTVEVVKPDGSSLGNLTPASAGTNTWEVTVPFNTASYSADGQYKIKVNEADTRDRAADQVIHTIRKDTTAPAVNTIDAPEAGKTGANALYETTYLFRGTAKDIDGSTDCAGLAKVLYAFTRTNSAPAASAYTEIPMSDGSWSVTKTLNSGKTATATGNLYEGTWYLYVIAEDKAGNKTAPVSRNFDIDMSSPVLGITSPADISQTAYTKNNSFAISGTATDTNGIDTLTVQVGEATAVPVPVTSGTWTYTVNRTDDNKDAPLSVKFVLTDVAGKTTEKTTTLFFDTQAPSVTITLPAANETTANNTYTLSGTVADTGAGVDASNATYVIKKGGTTVASGALTVTGASWNAENVSLGSAEGSLDLTITIKDKLGQSTSVDRTFYYDLNPPELKEFSITANGKTTNAGFKLAGTAWDTNGLASITVSDGTTTWTSTGNSAPVTLTPKTSDPGNAEANWNWNIQFVTGESNASNSKYVADGTKTFTITATDAAGKTVSVTRTVTVDTSLPSISALSVQDSLVGLDVSAYDKLTVTATDTGTGLAGVYYQVVAGASAPTFTSSNEANWTSLALGSTSWTGNVDFTGKAEGDYKIYVAAKDNAGNSFVYATPKAVTVDAKKPVVTITGPSDAGASNVNLTVRVTDTNPVAPVITVLDTNDDEIDSPGISVVEGTATATYKEWTVTVPFANAKYSSDGVYTIVVNETDTRTRAADEVTHAIHKDVSAPTASIDSPATGKTGVNSLYGSSFTFRGTANDNTGGSGVAKILYAFTRTDSAPAASAYTELAASDGTWSFSRDMNAGNSATAGTDNLYEGTWYMWLLAEDKAGNRTATPVSRSFAIDMSDPVLEVTSPADLTQTAYTKENKFIMSGTVSDTNGIQTLTIKIGSGTEIPVTVNSGTWTYTVNRTDANKDQLLSAKFVLTDNAGKTAGQTVRFFFDTQAPSVTITVPADNEITTTNAYTLSGTVADTGAGVAENPANATYATAKARYLIKKGATEVASGPLTVTGASWKAENINLGSSEGSLDLTIEIEDKVGQKTTLNRTFYYDKNLPVITETGIGPSLTTNEAFTFSGTASDTNALYNDGNEAIRITATKNGGSTNVIDEKINVSAGNWSKTYTPGTASGKLADGTYDFTFTVTDAANRTKTTTSSVTIDTVAPVVSTEAGKTSYLTDTASNGWFKKEYLGLKAVASDAASGIASVEYAVISNPSSVPTAASWKADAITWNTMTRGASSYTASAQMAGGTNYICIRVTDKAGNEKYTTQETAQVDLSAPAITGVYTDTACTQGLTNNTYMTGKKDIALYMKTNDAANTGTPELAGSGIASLVVTINGNEVNATAVEGSTDKYKLAVTGAGLDAYLGGSGSYIISAVISDKAGNSTTVSQLFSLQYDTTAPTAAFTSPAAGVTINKTITVTGTANDDQSLESVALYKGDFSSATPTDADKLADFTGNGRYNWTYTLNTFDNTNSPKTYIASSGSMTLTVIAKDTAGNVTKTPLTFSVNQANDCPEITISNIAFSGMTSAAPKWLIGSKVIYGSVTDDDGAILSLEYSKDNGTNWTGITQNNGSFTLTLDTDSTYSLLFRITDKNGSVFTTADAAALSRPVLKGSDDAAASDNKLYVTVDTTNPNADVPEFSLDGTTWTSDLLSNNTFGKVADNNTFYVRQYVYDANGIKDDVFVSGVKTESGVEVSIGSGEYKPADKVLDGSGNPVTKTIGGKDYIAYKYQITAAQIGEADSGIQTLNIKVTDKAGMSKETNATFSVDNDAPTVAVTSHADGDRVKGSFFLAGTSTDAPQFVGAASISYKVTASDTLANGEDWTPVATNLTTYGAHTVLGSNLSTWRIYFDDDVNNTTDYTHDKLLKKVLVSIPTYAAYLETNDDGKVVYKTAYHDASGVDHTAGELYKDITTLYIHFKATDAYNNTSYSFTSLELDPQGDIPSVEITYPGVTGYGWRSATNSKTYYTREQLPVVGGSAYDSLDNMTATGYTPKTISEINRTAKTIKIDGYTYTYFGGETVQGGIVRVQGSAEDENAIAAVYLQIDPTYNAADGFQWVEGSAGNALLPDGHTKLSEVTNNPYPVETITAGKTGIKVGTTGSWSFSLNRSSEFNGTSGNKNYVGIRAFAKDVDGNVSPASDVIVLTIDADTPRIGDSQELYLYQYSNNSAGTGTVTASQKYTDDMWLKGEWWLIGSVEDSNGINSITIDGNNAITGGMTISNTAEAISVWNDGTDNRTTGYIVKFKIGSSTANAFGSLDYVIYAEDKDTGSSKTVTKTISINYDNKAPELAAEDNTNFHISSTVAQSNGFYTLGSAVTEAASATGEEKQSGFDRVALYFVRRGTTSAQDRLFDTYFLKGETGNEMLLSGLTNEDGLYWKTQEVTRDPDFLNKFTLSTADANIHKGGMVKIGGAMYIITGINGNEITINGSPAILNASTKKENASFARALIVDHALTESNGNALGANGYYTDVTNDDGDCMVEAVTTQGTTTFWEANINSRNIPDGSIEIHYVAFDKAGNSASGVVNGTVANNAPRLAGVRYGADNNGDGNIAGNELRSDLFAISSETGKYTNSALRTSYVLGTKTVNASGVITTDDPVLKIKGTFAVIPEIVGGNGDLYYSWSVTKNGATAPYYSIASKKFGTGITGTDYSGTGAAAEITDAAVIKLEMKDLLKDIGTEEAPKVIEDGNNQLFTFTIWDSTEGMVAGSSSQHAVLEMVADVKIKDNQKPKAYIKPFYWTNKTNNSVYRTTDANENTVMQGHIDLAADLPAATFNQASGEMDADDKVSGAIVIEGTATDDTLLSGLYMRIYDADGNKFAFTGNQATYNTNYSQVATYNNSWTTVDKYTDNGWKFEIVGDDVFAENGHTTHWKLTLNTEKLTVPAINDLKVSIIATDKGEPTLSSDGNTITYSKNTSTAGTRKTSAESMTDFNQFDVVPYITSISTSLDNAYKSNTSVFNRSANGWYPVRRGEDITIKGWNLKNGTDDPTVTLGSTTLSATSPNVNTVVATITDSNASKSGELSITANSIASLNNKHNNALTYNLEKNGINNDTLTDARKLYVWSFNNEISSTSVRYPSFAVGKDENQTIGFVYDAGAKQVYRYTRGSSDSGTNSILDSSYTQWYDTSCAIDEGGHVFGSAMNGDSGSQTTYDRLSGTAYANYKFYAFPDLIRSSNYNSTSGAYTTDYSSILLESSYGNGRFNAQRITNPKLVVTGSQATTLYTAYYDNNYNQVVFRYGTADYEQYQYTSQANNVTFTYNNSKKGFTITGSTNHNGRYVLIDGTYYPLTRSYSSGYYYTLSGYTGTTDFTSNVYTRKENVFTYTNGIQNRASGSDSAGNKQIIAGTSANGDNANRGGEYVAVGVVPAGVTGAGTAVVAWTDGQQLWFSYNSSPATVNNATWTSHTTLIDSDYAGWYVDMDVDAAGGIHIAYYGSSAGDLRYAYIPAYNQASAAEIVTVDSYLSVGTNISISATGEKITEKVTENGVEKDVERYIPYISYYMSAMTKTSFSNRVAWPTALVDGKFADGATNDQYTGNWEVMTVPTSSTPLDYSVGVGVKKNDSSTNKPILGYGTKAGLETAQLQ